MPRSKRRAVPPEPATAAAMPFAPARRLLAPVAALAALAAPELAPAAPEALPPAPVEIRTPRTAGTRAEIVAEARIDAEGRVVSVATVSCFLETGADRADFRRLERAVLKAFSRWRFEPARVAGEAVPSVARQVFRFEGGLLAGLAAPGSRLGGSALLLADIDAAGRVRQARAQWASSPEVAAAAEAAARQWRFRPAYEAGQPQPRTFLVPFALRGD